MHPTLPSARAVLALLTVAALTAAGPALAQYREPPPPAPWPDSAEPADDDERPPAPPAARHQRPPRDDGRDDDERDAARPAPPAPYYPARPSYRPRPSYPPPPPAYAPVGGPRGRYFLPHLEVALRGGVASPSGMAIDGVPMRDLFGEQLTLGLDVGLRATPHVYMGLFVEGGLGAGGDFVDSTCTSRSDCGSASGRIGAALHYHFAPYGPVDPWIGYGVALAGATVSGQDSLGSYERTLSGVEYAKLMAGVDLRLGGTATLGFYGEWTTGTFSQIEDRADGVVVDSGGVGPAVTHSWFTMGPRIKF